LHELRDATNELMPRIKGLHELKDATNYTNATD